VPDQLSLSLWIRGFDAVNMLRHFQELLRVFPFSQLRPGAAALKIYAIEFAEPPIFERVYPEGEEVETVIEACREFENDDCAYLVDGFWEMFRPNEQGEWRLGPSRVTLSCLGPAFDSVIGDHLRIDVGTDAAFLPDPEDLDSERPARSNLAGLVRLARELQTSLPVERRQLWSETGENFAERLLIG
jgi:hypothetical protein